jgi:hypothetical protein
MPYREDGSDVPDRIKGKKKRRQWAHVWNGEYAQHGDEGRAFATANSIYNQSKKVTLTQFLKFGTDETGFTKGEYGPFKCATCKYSSALGDEHVCTNDNVHEDPDVPSDSFGNKIIEPEDCCNNWTPVEE